MNTQIMTPLNQSDVDTTIEMYPLENCEVAKVETSMASSTMTITFKHSYVYVNMEFIKCTSGMMYAQFLIDRSVRKLILRSCNKMERDSVRLRTMNESVPKPRHVLAHEFCSRMFEYMKWDTKYRYKMVGTLINCSKELLVVFDLATAEKSEMPSKGFAPQKATEPLVKPGSSFGDTVQERIENPLVSQFAESITIPVEIPNNAMENTNGSHNTDLVETEGLPESEAKEESR